MYHYSFIPLFVNVVENSIVPVPWEVQICPVPDPPVCKNTRTLINKNNTYQK